jgi:drug/metabolite transporter (DMT)-like permease
MCGIRFTIAGGLMLAYLKLRGENVVFSPRQLMQLAVVGVLLLVGGNLTLACAEKYVPSGLVALLLAVSPLWFLLLDALLVGEHGVPRRGLVGVGLGMVGSVVLIWPALSSGGALGRKELWWSLALLGASFSWALGSVLSKRWQSGAPSLGATAWQMSFAGAANLLIALFAGDPSRVVWTAKGLGAVLYLIVCGSWIGYTAYIWLLRHVPTSKVSTYAYVNPVVAVFLGWWVLGERIDRYILLGSAIVIASVILVTGAKVKIRAVPGRVPLKA